MDIEEPKSCPCKRIPIHLSSFTAAEYGDSAALRSRLLSKKSSSQQQQRQCPTLDSAGNTPLHFAAQHGHTETVAMLLRTGAYDNMYCNNNTNAMNSDNIQLYQVSGVTPLHRACYSGAIGTVRLLLEHIITIVAKNTTNNNNDNNNSNEHILTSILLLPDTSFNDYQTSLHKCASGGRYLVIQLLLDFMAHHHDHHDSTKRNSTLLLLSAKDAFGRTPLDVAREKQQLNNNNERQSVQRWDTIAGGYADWDICVQLLTTAQRTNDATTSIISNPTIPNTIIQKQSQQQSWMGSTTTISTAVSSDCTDITCSGRQCNNSTTASWEQSFRAALLGAVVAASTTTTMTTTISGDDNDVETGIVVTTSINSSSNESFDDMTDCHGPQQQEQQQQQHGSRTNKIKSNSVATGEIYPPILAQNVVGRPCSDCGKMCIVLMPSRRNHTQLVCSTCRRCS